MANIVAISCICVGIGAGGSTPMLARISVVDAGGNEILPSTFVRPTAPVTDYRTNTTGVQEIHLNSNTAVPFATIQQTVSNIIHGKFLVGHKLWLALSVLGIAHPAIATRDLALYMPYRTTLRSPNHIFELHELVWSFMMRRIQVQGEDPTENARASMDLYRSSAAQWEASIGSGTWPCALPPDAYSRCFT